ncbi:MAG: hypothetical protein AAB116_01680 [Candidatus Poribacteria bacterium]
MSTTYVKLNHISDGKFACLREISGHDEQSTDGAGTFDAIQLLDRLLVSVSESNLAPGDAKKLTSSDRDRLLATVYMRLYGSRIESSINCVGCKVAFDIDFSLEDLVTQIDSETNQIEIERQPDGVFKLPDGRRFRLPTGDDEYAILGKSSEEAEKILLERCVIEGDLNKDSEIVQQAMRDLAPVLDLDMDVKCPECDKQQMVHFDIQYYLLSRIRQERKQLAFEVHQLAKTYAWGLNEILDLPRNIRKTYVALVEQELDLQRRRGIS